MGKTALATSIKEYVTEDGAFFVSGKFAHSLVVSLQQHQRKPLEPFVDALVEWVDESRDDLRRHGSLAVALREWELADPNADYLLTSARLAEYT